MDKMHKTHWIIIIVALLGISTGLSGCGSPNPQPEFLTPIPTLAPASAVTLNPALQQVAGSGVLVSAGMGQGNAALGAAVFMKNCTICHGLQGEGVSAPALRNDAFIQDSDDDAVFNTIADGRSGTRMPAWILGNGGPLDDAQISDVVAFLHTLQKISPLPSATPGPPEPTEAPPEPNAPPEEPARPSNPGDAGQAASMVGDAAKGETEFGQFCAACHGPEGREEVGIANPGSDDGTVPPLNPLDPTLIDSDPKVFAFNLDLFIEHGSIPSGPAPWIMMPSFGDSKLLSDQQIADLIAYLMQLNGGG
jgi:mono/diheme cytochrome c family protein